MKNLFKEYLALTSTEKLQRLRYLRKKWIKPDRTIEFCNNNTLVYYDFENFCIRELNGNIVLKINEMDSLEDKEKLLRYIDFGDDFYCSMLINKGFNELDYFYIAGDFFGNSERHKELVSEILEEIKQGKV